MSVTMLLIILEVMNSFPLSLKTFSYTLLLQHYHIIDSDSLFIDGTKVQADANRYSFVWSKATERYDEALNEKISTLYDQFIQNQVNITLSEEEKITEYGVHAMIEATNNSLEQLEEII